MNALEKRLLAAIAAGHPDRRMEVSVRGQLMRVAPLTWNEIAVAVGVPERDLTDPIAHLVAADSIDSARQSAGFFKRLRGEDDTTFFFATPKGRRLLQGDTPEQGSHEDVSTQRLENVRKITHHLGYYLTRYGYAFSLVSLGSGYDEFATASQIALVTLATDIREAGHDITKLMAFMPHTMAMVDILKDWKDRGMLREDIFQNDARAMVMVATV
ncbi:MULTISPECIES: hypothetical protein [Sinorhizobium]|uniref:hypothetical protein n=1 Tax=Sinorhizobium TaxID=28105 RepID=UPI000BEA50F7|nr:MULTISPECIES: hypothetical protein [Sinorhizobium]PDT50940.1 hypothetical protein CO664_24650 [Sinorhizobium sp. NG07B]POH25055.1 hypothetical protein ATY30_28885 [Sinorhizobium americanum]